MTEREQQPQKLPEKKELLYPNIYTFYHFKLVRKRTDTPTEERRSNMDRRFAEEWLSGRHCRQASASWGVSERKRNDELPIQAPAMENTVPVAVPTRGQVQRKTKTRGFHTCE